jgi:hypothetical protein
LVTNLVTNLQHKQRQHRTSEDMGFNRRKMEDERRRAAEKEVVALELKSPHSRNASGVYAFNCTHRRLCCLDCHSWEAGSSVYSLSNTEILYKKKNRNNSGSSPVRKLGRSTELNAARAPLKSVA